MRVTLLAVVCATTLCLAVSGCATSADQTPSTGSTPASTSAAPLPVIDITNDLSSTIANPLSGYGAVGEMVNDSVADAAAVTSAHAVDDPDTGRRWIMVNFSSQGPLPPTLFVGASGGGASGASLEPVCRMQNDSCTDFEPGWSASRLPGSAVTSALYPYAGSGSGGISVQAPPVRPGTVADPGAGAHVGVTGTWTGFLNQPGHPESDGQDYVEPMTYRGTLQLVDSGTGSVTGTYNDFQLQGSLNPQHFDVAGTLTGTTLDLSGVEGTQVLPPGDAFFMNHFVLTVSGSTLTGDFYKPNGTYMGTATFTRG